MMLDDDPSVDPAGRALWYLVPLGIVILLFAIGGVTVASLRGSDGSSDEANAAQTTKADLPDYWTVKDGQSYSQIALRTGLTVERLEELNPKTDPSTLRPGQRLKLRSDVAPPRTKPKGPRYRTVRKGESFGSIATATGKSIAALRRLNPKVKPAELQPGDRLRLRR